jgi:hypothetical protein
MDQDHVGETPCFVAVIDGLTKRELFSAMAMQGLLACPPKNSELSIAETAVSTADALIVELAK